MSYKYIGEEHDKKMSIGENQSQESKHHWDIQKQECALKNPFLRTKGHTKV